MAAGSYVLAMTSVSDTKEGLERLTNALFRIDNRTGQKKESIDIVGMGLPRAETVYPIAGAERRSRGRSGSTLVPWEKAVGAVSAEYAYLYPPGCPLTVPGERITKETADWLSWYEEHGFAVEGLKKERYIEVLV